MKAPERYAPWSEFDDDFIRRKWARLGGLKVAARLGRTLTACQQRASALGVKRRPGVPDREEFMSLCIDHTAPQIAEKCGVSYQAVWQWAEKYGCRPKVAPKGGRRIVQSDTTPIRLCYLVQGGIWE